MNKIIITAVFILMTACAHDEPITVKPERVVVKEVEYVVRVPPKELLTLPPAVEKINIDEAKQSDIARWILAGEERTRLLEDILRQIGLFFKLEQAKLDEQAAKENKAELERANKEEKSKTIKVEK